MKRILALTAVLVMGLSLLTACGVDPNVRQDATAADDYQVATTAADGEKSADRYTAYATGKTDPVILNGVEVDVNAFALRSHELAYMIGESQFDDPEQMQIDAATQYAMTHIFFDDFYRIQNSDVSYRTVTPEQVKDIMKAQFGKVTHDPTKSILYNPTAKKLEMWMPEYGTNLYYHIDAAQVDGDELVIDTTFYREKAQSTLLCRTAITVGLADGKPVIKSLRAVTE